MILTSSIEMSANMTDQEVIEKTATYVKSELKDAEGGHDWWHIERVRKIALSVAKAEPASLLVIELGALLHDIADSKFNNGDETIGVEKATAFLRSIAVDEGVIEHIDGSSQTFRSRAEMQRPISFQRNWQCCRTQIG